MKTKMYARTIVFTLCTFIFADAESYQFWPTDAEWETWPGYCQARYAITAEGRNTKFAQLVTEPQKAELQYWQRAGIVGIHHFCAGTIWLNRARMEKDPERRSGMLKNARQETQYAFARSDNQSALFVNVAIQLATVMFEDSNHDSALELLKSTIARQPENAVLYSATAVMQRRLGRLVEAKETLLSGYRAVDGKSAEISYNLGLISIEMGQLDDAVNYAKQAYEKGYPLTGLRTKLERLGRM